MADRTAPAVSTACCTAAPLVPVAVVSDGSSPLPNAEVAYFAHVSVEYTIPTL